MKEREWKLCENCEEAIYDPDDSPCFKCGSSCARSITRSQVLEVYEGDTSKEVAIKTKYWGNLL